MASRRYQPDRCRDGLLDRIDAANAVSAHSPLSLGGFITQTWLPRKRAHVRATTAHRYSWIVSHYMLPRLGDVPLRSLRSEHLDDLYEHLLAAADTPAGRSRQRRCTRRISWSETHSTSPCIVSSWTTTLRCRCTLHGDPVAERPSPACGTPRNSRTFLAVAKDQRLYPALHLAAHTGMRRGELVGLKWTDFDADSPASFDLQDDPVPRRTARRVRGQDANQSPLRRPRRRHRLAAPAMASPTET